MTLDHWLARLALDDVASEELSELALRALTEGHESLPLAALAGSSLRERSAADLRELLDRGLRDIHKVVPDRVAAARTLKQYYATQVATGALAPRLGASRIVDLATTLSDVLPDREYAGDGFGVARLLGLYYSHDDVAEDDEAARAEIDAELVKECRALAAEEAG
jgi:hypothetical protein